MLLPGVPVDEAQVTLTRLQRTLSASLFMHDGREVFVTFSAGVTRFRAGRAAGSRRWSARTRRCMKPSAPARIARASGSRPASLTAVVFCRGAWRMRAFPRWGRENTAGSSRRGADLALNALPG